MRIVTKYKCDVCSMEYNKPDKAMECEKLGKEIPLANMFDHVLVRDDWNGGLGESWDELILYKIDDIGHYIVYNFGILYDEEDYHPITSVCGNEEFKEKCKVVKK